MAEESQSWPLAPARIHNRSDQEDPAFKAIRKERSNKCFVYVFAAIVVFSIALLVFALIVLRAKSPEVRLRSVAVRSLRYANSPWPSFNATLVAQLTIKNPNFGPYRFQNSSARILYGGAKIGERRIGGGSAGARATKRISVAMEVRSSRLPQGDNTLSADLNSGALNLTGYARITGRVHLIKILKNRKSKEMKCSMILILKSKTIKDLRCN